MTTWEEVPRMPLVVVVLSLRRHHRLRLDRLPEVATPRRGIQL